MDYNIKANKYKLKLKLKLFTGGIPEHSHFNVSSILPPVSPNIVYINSVTKKTSTTKPTIDFWVKKGEGNNVWFKNNTTGELVWILPPDAWIRTNVYRNVNTKEVITVLPPSKNIWEYITDGTDSWYENINTNESKWEPPPDSWIIKYQYINPSKDTKSITLPLADTWKEVHEGKDIWYVNSRTKESHWIPPPNSWVEKTIDTQEKKVDILPILDKIPILNKIPTFVYEDFEINNYQGAGTSDDIWPIITDYYKSYKKNISIIGKNDKSNLFKFIPMNIDSLTEPILGKGTYTAVYLIKDINKKINDNSDKYILRIYIRDDNNNTSNMFKYKKVLDEYGIFKEYMAKIYFYGSLYKPRDQRPLSIIENRIPLPFDCNITKIYNTLSKKNVHLLSNKQKLKFVLQNIKMLNALASNGYIHCDYKLDNVAYDNPDEMNVILIDYDITTLQQLVKTNKLIQFTHDNMVNTIVVSSTYPPMYISNNLELKYPINVFFKLPLSKWDKYSIGGLIDIINTLNIKYNFDTIKIPPELSNGKVDVLMSRHIVHFLKLNDTTYDTIPTYKELYNIFTYLYDKRFID